MINQSINQSTSLCLVKECRELEERYKVDYTSKILVSEPEDRHIIIKEMEKDIHKEDLDHGEACDTAIKKLVRIVSYPSYACSPFPLCNVTELNKSLSTHVINEHTNSNESWDTLFNSILNLNSSLYSHILCFTIIFNHYTQFYPHVCILCLLVLHVHFLFVNAQVGLMT